MKLDPKSVVKPAEFCRRIRNSFGGAKHVYKYGSCIQFHLILAGVYPGAEPYWCKKKRHCITKIGRKYYDITGIVKKPKDALLIVTIKHMSRCNASTFTNSYLSLDRLTPIAKLKPKAK